METLDDIKEVAEQNIKFAYDKGYEDGLKDRIGLGWMDGYTKGLEEAWECAKKIYRLATIVMFFTTDGSLKSRTMKFVLATRFIF